MAETLIWPDTIRQQPPHCLHLLVRCQKLVLRQLELELRLFVEKFSDLTEYESLDFYKVGVDQQERTIQIGEVVGADPRGRKVS